MDEVVADYFVLAVQVFPTKEELVFVVDAEAQADFPVGGMGVDLLKEFVLVYVLDEEFHVLRAQADDLVVQYELLADGLALQCEAHIRCVLIKIERYGPRQAQQAYQHHEFEKACSRE